MACPRLITTAHPTERLVGQAPAIAALRAQICHLAAFDSLGNPSVPTILLHGETGTGKGLVARIMHDSGPRTQGPFLEVNCAAIPESMLEAELFGFEAGAFTDAKRAKPGLWEAASGGTLFLDEIDALPSTLQGKLLTVIEAKYVRRLGAVAEHVVDVKLIAATPTDLYACVAEGLFRADLYHRLAVVLLTIPPLRERGEDIVLLARHFLGWYAEAHRTNPGRLTQGAEAWLQRYAWPGNVRELGHLIERVTLLSPEPLISSETLEQLCLPSAQPAPPAAAGSMDEAAQIRQALLRTAGNVARAARLVGMSRGAFRHRMARYGITPANEGGQVVVPLPHRRAGRHEGTTAPQHDGQAAPLSQEAPAPAPGWEQKLVAVLAVEVTWPVIGKGQRHPYEPWTVTSHWEQAMAEKARGFGGVLLQCSPSLVVIVFGVPQTLEQAPQRAVQAALALRQLVTEASEREPHPELRMAVHWGWMLVNVMASNPTARLLPEGEVFALPVRLLAGTEAGEIVVSPAVAHVVEGWYVLEAREGATGMQAWLVVGLHPRPSPLRMYGQRPLSKFVGRERELAVLDDHLRRVGEGRGQVVGIVGEPGVGKSRLCYEFTRTPELHGWQILETSASSYDQSTPFLPVVNLLKAYFEIEAHDTVPMLCDKVTTKLQTLDEALDPCLPAFLSLLNVPVDDRTWQSLDPPQRRQRTLDAVKCLLLWQSHVQPLLLVVENLHWIDGETQAFLDTLINSLPTTRLLLLATYRPEYQHTWGSKTYYTQLRLDPLPPESADALLQALLKNDVGAPGHPLLQDLTQHLIERTEGNPFFIEESIRSLVETHVLVGEPGTYWLAKPIQHLQVPATVQAVLAARIDRLPLQEKRLLQTAAVIGTEVPFALLQAIAELPEEALHCGLTHLQASEFLYETRLFPELVYTFKHALTHEVAYGSLLQDRRRAVHAQIVDAIEQLYPDRLLEHVERLAHHALRGEVWDKALSYFRQAGAMAGTRSAYRQAVACFEQALETLKYLPENRHTLEQDIDLRLDLRTPLNPLGEIGRIHDHLREAEILATALDDQRRLGEISDRLCQVSWRMGDYGAALVFGQRALAISMALGEVRVQFNTNLHMASAYHAMGEYGRAIECLTTNLVSLESVLPPRSLGAGGNNSVASRAKLSHCLAELGSFAEGITHGAEAIRMAEALDHPFTCAIAYGDVGYLYLRQGDVPKAIAVLERGVELCQVWQIQLLFPYAVSLLGAAYVLSGRVVEALPLLMQALEQAIAMETVIYQAFCRLLLGEAQMLAGRLAEAHALTDRALALARAHHERGHEDYALRLLGDIAARRDPPKVEQAEAHYGQALALAQELDMRPLQAHCHLGLGTLYAKIGRREPARAELSIATALYRSMDMTFWLPQAEAALTRAL
jgi:transcriptional regulator with AAA-type ATPase domain/tetratricopeptide (TPR) repeat protein